MQRPVQLAMIPAEGLRNHMGDADPAETSVQHPEPIPSFFTLPSLPFT